MRKRTLLPLLFLILLVVLAAAPCGWSQNPTPSGSAAGEMTEGEVRKVDPENGRLTIRHGEIKNLGMPPMTMVFQVQEKAWLEGIQPGSKIRFQAVEEGGKYVVTALEPAP